MQRIRRVKVGPARGGFFYEDAFVFDETESEMEVLLADDEHFEVLTFDKGTLVSACGRFQIPHIEL